MAQCVDPECWRCDGEPHAHPLTEEAREVLYAEHRKIDLRERYGLADMRPGHYYVTASQNNLPGDAIRMRGPFRWHYQAIEAVDAARAAAEEINSSAFWYFWGTSRYATDQGPGVLDTHEKTETT